MDEVIAILVVGATDGVMAQTKAYPSFPSGRRTLHRCIHEQM